MPRFRAERTGALVRLGLLLLAMLLATAGGARADGPWSGFWSTMWRDGGAQLQLDQQGDHVTGTYPLYGGRVDAVANGSRLEGRWFEGSNTGSFIFVMDRDGHSFSGRYDNGEWWTGARSTAGTAEMPFTLATPRETFQRFVTNGNIGRSGRPDSWGAVLQTVDFGTAAATMPLADQLERVRQLFALVDLTTFRLWSIPDDASADTVQVQLNQVGTGASMTLTIVRDAKGNWRIRMPTSAEFDADRHALLAAHGGQPPPVDAFKRLQNPRDTMRSFIEGMADWNGAGRALALSTLDLSAVPEVLRDARGPLTAQFLRRLLNQIGLVGLQSIPNDGTDRTPYVHFDHPAGRIVIAPSGPEADAPWKFTTQTVADVDDLFRAIDGLPPPLASPPGLIPDAPFFTMRGMVRAHAPGLLGHVGPVEYWQMIATVLIAGISVLVGTIFARIVCQGAGWLAGDQDDQPRLFTWAVGIVGALIFVSRFPVIFGVPEEIRRYTYPVLGIVLTTAGSIALWHLLRVAGVVLQRIGDRTATATDDILFTLLLATARLAVVVSAFLGVAYFLSIPTSGILAGLGVGGLAFAFASRETLSNVFGAGILVADRPFHRGDWITTGEVEGAVEHVGIRSTRVRTAQDSLVVVPNGKLADSTINNLGTRRHRLIKVHILVTAGATPDRLDTFATALRERILNDDAFVASRTDVGVGGIAETGIQVDLITYLSVTTSSAERAAKHALLVDVVRVAETCGLTLGAGMQTPEQLSLEQEAAKA